MAGSFGLLLKEALKHWFSARGFVLVLAAALVPLVLTGAWVATHQKDVAVQSLSWTPEDATEGEPVNISAVFVNKGRFGVGAFNASLAVGRVFGSSLSPIQTNKTLIEGLGPGETRTLVLQWTPTPGYFVALADADSDDDLQEIEEYNNQRPEWIEVHFGDPDAAGGPTAPANLTAGSGGGSADVALGEIIPRPDSVTPGQNVTLSVLVINNGPTAVTNVNVTLRAGNVFSGELFSAVEKTEPLSLASGESRTVALEWNQVSGGVWWLQAYANVTSNPDPDAANNHVTRPFIVHLLVPEDAEFPDPPERLTIKQFYLDLLEYLHIRLLLPFIGLFYAAGVLADDKGKGNLTYVLTRPVPRPLIPIAKFLASYVVAATAVVAGLLVTYFLLLGVPSGNDIGFLTTPVFISLVSLFAYGAFFILLGVLVERPYLVGIAWVVLWETFAPFFVELIQKFTISHHLIAAIIGKPDDPAKPETLSDGWRLDQGVQWLPLGDTALYSLIGVLVAAVVFLVIAAGVMRSREFDL